MKPRDEEKKADEEVEEGGRRGDVEGSGVLSIVLLVQKSSELL